jgi:PKD repeat protein
MNSYSQLSISSIAFFILFATSCGRTPFPCFSISEYEDSIPVNKTIYFNAVCSDKAKEYFWSFPNDSVAYEQAVSYIFRDTGVFEVSLLVANGTKSRVGTKKLTVKQP